MRISCICNLNYSADLHVTLSVFKILIRSIFWPISYTFKAKCLQKFHTFGLVVINAFVPNQFSSYFHNDPLYGSNQTCGSQVWPPRHTHIPHHECKTTDRKNAAALNNTWTSSIQFPYFPEQMNHETKRLQCIKKMPPLLRENSQRAQVPRKKRCIAPTLHFPNTEKLRILNPCQDKKKILHQTERLTFVPISKPDKSTK